MSDPLDGPAAEAAAELLEETIRQLGGDVDTITLVTGEARPTEIRAQRKRFVAKVIVPGVPGPRRIDETIHQLRDQLGIPATS